jgi:general secretion pathway protein D
VVIGGLIDDTFAVTTNSVPCLGNLPGASWFFKNLSRNTQKTNLFVFLTPHVVQTSDEVSELYNQKRLQMNQIEEGNVKLYKD